MKRWGIYFIPIYIVLILLVVFSTQLWNRFSARAVAPTPLPAVSLEVADGGEPQSMSIPQLDINLSIIPGNFDQNTKTWNVSRDKAHFATVTKHPNTVEGNTLLYGHNSDAVLGKTRDLKLGDTLIIKTDKGMSFLYEYSEDKVVDPSDVSIFSYQGPPRVTIQTCTGLFDSMRRFMTFKFKQII